MRVRWLSLAALVLSSGVLMVGAGTAAAAPTPYTALGDSYTSGDGTGVFYSGDGGCYRSPDAYPPLVAAADGYALTFAACSGATTQTVISGQLGSLSSSTGLVSVQVGGNDAGFTHVILDCAAYYFPCSGAIRRARSFIEHTLPGLLDTTYADIRAHAPGARVVVLGYPRLFTSAGRRCGFNVLTSGHERALNRAADLLDSVTASAAAAHGFTYVDPRSAFAGHELCSSSPWLNNVSWPVIKSFHPNIAGEAELARLVEAQL